MIEAVHWELRGEEALFYEYCDQRRLVMQKCSTCAEFTFPPRPVCNHCRGTDLTWTDLSGQGSIDTFSVEMRPSPSMGLEAPYIIAIVRLEEGPRMLSNILCNPMEVEVDTRVQVDFRPFGGKLVPVFLPGPT